MTKTQMAALIVGILMPFLVTVLKQHGLSRTWNLVIAIAACAVAGVVVVWAAGTAFTWANVVGIIGLVFTAAQGFYAAYWRNSPAEAIINLKTSLKK